MRVYLIENLMNCFLVNEFQQIIFDFDFVRIINKKVDIDFFVFKHNTLKFHTF